MSNGGIGNIHNVGVSGMYEVGRDIEIFGDSSWSDGGSFTGPREWIGVFEIGGRIGDEEGRSDGDVSLLQRGRGEVERSAELSR